MNIQATEKEKRILKFEAIMPDYVTPVEEQELWQMLAATAQGYLDRLWIDKVWSKTGNEKP